MRCPFGETLETRGLWTADATAPNAVTKEEEISLNSNRNNRRRGRGHRNQGGANSANRIDNRARGNAPQLLDKYKKLAQDAQHNGDRVQAEYYLQFADHYFRVIADNKARQEEARAKRQDERDQANDDDDHKDDGDDRRRGNRRPRHRRDERADASSEGERAVEGEAVDPSEQQEQRKPRRTRRKPRDADQTASGEIDAGVLPPAIGSDDGEEQKPRRRRRSTKGEDGEDKGGDDLQAVG